MNRPLVLRKPVIAITGSAGKTTTKEMIGSVLRRRWRIVKTPYNQNTVPYTRKLVKKITAAHGAVVLEFGMLRAGHIRKHCQIIQPNYGVITNVGTAHIGNVGGTIAGVARAKSELIRFMRRTGKLFLNADDPHSRLLSTGGFRGRIFRIGVKEHADYQAYNIRYRENGMSFDVKLDGTEYTFSIPVPGEHNIYNALFAIAVCHQLNCSPGTIQLGLRSFRRPKSRLTMYRLSRGIKVIDDSYSANPSAVKAALDVLAKVGTGTNVAVLGSMLEMGNYAVKGHKLVGRYAAQKKVDYLYTLGKSARYIKRGATQSGFPQERAVHCATKAQLHRLLRRRLRPNTTFLVKASHKMKMKETVQYLRRASTRLSSSD
ncbi:UDP-N-acetylmuramoyl-tripeptide--D-alanyl-D-alanine ligase [Brevibacillus sp. SYP-B805]|uniref:UDP-N-acetylmuramoyl-tripeptide--D-alanyl-D- alanine ligase n=1 Tax=Brevibacillus sp. SYP-B805 TaxID=1578199 RepID=UPI001F49BE4F|nr:UDP-N-acetylmuramoyl-tripeptide--D-alanyl-D-alanine ligase [Brevibacillus sp. SYP-B805]